jgi:cysteinyl-tRNA synthetase
MKIYNTLTKKKEEFKSKDGKLVKMYVCGPTVYDNAHIGNLRTYINVDLLRRWLEYSGYKVNEVMNITDIEDKIIKKAKEEKVLYKNVTQKYEKLFLEDLKKLNIELPEKMPHATDDEVIKQIITIIQDLLDKGIAYKSDDGSVYFSVKKFKNYGNLSGIDLSGIEEGARVAQDEYEKENAQDFALWKTSKEGEPSWEALFGKGRPGWHIECSAMSTKYLGDTLDIHAGGVDLIFPHHENEIAQSESFTGKKFVNYWFHCEHLLVEGQKMSKSLGNIYTLDEMCQKYNVEALALRILVLTANYRERLNFTKESILAADITLERLHGDVELLLKSQQNSSGIKINGLSNLIESTKRSFIEVMNDDISSSRAISSIFSFLNKVNGQTNRNYEKNDATVIYNLLIEIDKVLGLGLNDVLSNKPIVLPAIVRVLVKKREQARQDKDWILSDKLRAEIQNLGFEVKDTPEGPNIKKS